MDVCKDITSGGPRHLHQLITLSHECHPIEGFSVDVGPLKHGCYEMGLDLPFGNQVTQIECLSENVLGFLKCHRVKGHVNSRLAIQA